MANQQTVSNHKIIFSVFFVCAALMSSVFIYHARDKQNLAPILENGTLFNAPRDIKPFKLTTETYTVSQDLFRDHWSILFFGFTHCSTICPNALNFLDQTYTLIKKQYPQLQVVMVTLDPQRDGAQQISNYTKQFNQDFIGLSGKLNEIRQLQSQFGIYSSFDPATPVNNDQLEHSSSLLLINPQGKWVGLFKINGKPMQLAQAISKSIRHYE